MHTRNMLIGLARTVAVSSVLLAPGVFPPAEAQNAQDPPSRVGRVALLTGTVSFRSSEQTTWDSALLNYPVTSGNSFWTEPAAVAEIEISSAHLVLDQSTEFDIGTLDDRTLVATEPQGALYMRLVWVRPGDSYQITTPRGLVTIATAGRYEIVAGDADHPTLVTVVEGNADVDIGTASLTVTPHQTASVTGTDSFGVAIVPAVNDAFLTARLASERPPPAAVIRRVTPPEILARMTGGDALMNTGTWAPSPQYGRIWYPPVEADWVPYRHGHWGYVAPWGWTWIDAAPWGFAPFHYGRWVQDGRRWGWVPVQQGVVIAANVRPIYAPALVTFIGLAAGAVTDARRGPDFGGSVGWIPLGPQEVYRPPYRVSTNYVRNVNVTDVRNVTNVTNVTSTATTTTINNYVNRSAVTVVPAAVMTASQPIATRIEPVTPRTIALARPVQAAPVQPTTATIGVTPAVAKALNLKPEAGAPPPARPAAPGPAPELHAGGVQIVPHAPTAARPGTTAAPAGRLPNAAGRPATPGGKPAAVQPVTLPRLRPVPAGGTALPASAVPSHVPPATAVPGQPPQPAVGTTHPAQPPSAASKPVSPPAIVAPAAPPVHPVAPPQTRGAKQTPSPTAAPAEAPGANPPATKPAGPVAPHPGTAPARVPEPKPTSAPAAAAPAATPTHVVPGKPEAPHPVTAPARAPEPKPTSAPAAPAPAATPAHVVPTKPAAPHPVTAPARAPEPKPTSAPAAAAPAATPAHVVPTKPAAPHPVTAPAQAPERKPAPTAAPAAATSAPATSPPGHTPPNAAIAPHAAPASPSPHPVVPKATEQSRNPADAKHPQPAPATEPPAPKPAASPAPG